MRVIYLFCILIIVFSLYLIISKCKLDRTENNNNQSDKHISLKIEPIMSFPNVIDTNSINNTINKVFTNMANKNKLIIFTTTWCHVCKKFKANKVNIMNGILARYPLLKIEDIDCTSDVRKCKMIINGKEETINAVPTIILRKYGSNDDILYDRLISKGIKGDNSVDDILKFLDVHLKELF